VTDTAAPELHAMNHHFEWVDHPGPFRRITESQARHYDSEGFFLLPGAFTSDEVDALVEAIDPFEEEQEAALRRLEGGRLFIARAGEITFTVHLVTRSAALREFSSCPLLVDVCADLLGPDVRLYWDQAVYKKPGTDAPFPWHQDNGYAFVEPQQYLTCWIALTDATIENGCPWVVPGLHRRGTLSHRPSDTGFVCLTDPAEAVPVHANRGDIVVFSSLTPHATGPNNSGEVRKAYIVQYAPTRAEVLRPDAEGTVTRIAADDPRRQYEVLRRGRPVDPTDLTPAAGSGK
jgi:ectoine hydroxylase-related dioxygenase (phytanoyl-CoA dioxygenase family)